MSLWGISAFPFRRTRMNLPLFLQMEASECGLASLAMVAAYHGSGKSLVTLRDMLPISRNGMNVRAMIEIAATLNLSGQAVRVEMDQLDQLQLPCVLHWNMDHFVVLKAVGRRHLIIHDPAIGRRRLTREDFGHSFTGIAIEFSPAAGFEPSPIRKISTRQWLSYLPGFWRGLAVTFGLAALLEFIAITLPLFMQWVVDDVMESRDLALLDGLVLAFGILILIRLTLDILRDWITAVVRLELMQRWLDHMFRHLMRLPLAYFDRRHHGDIAQHFASIGSIQRLLGNHLIEALLDGLLAVATLSMIVFYSPAGAAAIVAVAGLYLLIRCLLQPSLHQAWSEEINMAGRQQSHLFESLRGIQTIRLHNVSDLRRTAWLHLTTEQADAELRARQLSGFSEALQRGLFALLRMAMVWQAIRQCLGGDLSLGMAMAFLAYFDQFILRIGSLIDRIFDIALVRLHLERLADVFLTAPENTDPVMAPALIKPFAAPPSISFDRVSLRHSVAEAPVLRDISLEIGAGECVAITGASGSGKTSLLKLLLGLYEPSSGEIRIGGHALSSLGHTHMRDVTGTVMQDDFLFSGSIFDNIACFDPQAREERVIEAARQAAIHDDICARPMRYLTLLGENGLGLSGGQRQRILLARALYKQPRILVLDEATSHLDADSEMSVNEAIRKLPLTRIIVAHRRETIAMADREIRLPGRGAMEAASAISGFSHIPA